MLLGGGGGGSTSHHSSFVELDPQHSSPDGLPLDYFISEPLNPFTFSNQPTTNCCIPPVLPDLLFR